MNPVMLEFFNFLSQMGMQSVNNFSSSIFYRGNGDNNLST